MVQSSLRFWLLLKGYLCHKAEGVSSSTASRIMEVWLAQIPPNCSYQTTAVHCFEDFRHVPISEIRTHFHRHDTVTVTVGDGQLQCGYRCLLLLGGDGYSW